MSLFRVYVDGALFYHPQMSKLAITDARIEEDAENIDSMTLSAPFNHPYLSSIRPLASSIVCKKGDAVVFEGRALDNGTDFYNTHTWTCESCLAYLKDSVQPPYDYKGTLTIHHILTRDTVDADVLDALKHKDMTQQNLIAAVKAHLTI